MTGGVRRLEPEEVLPHHTGQVEVLRRYSNRTDLLRSIQDVLRHIEENDQTDEPGVCLTGRGGGLSPVRLRLGDTTVHAFVAEFAAGATRQELVGRYGVSLSSVKRLLRASGVNRKPLTS